MRRDFIVLILSLGRRNRTLHLYEVTATNLLVFGFSRANAETCVRLRGVGAAMWWWCEKFSCWEGEPQRRLTNTTITSLRTRPVYSNHGILFTASPFFLYGIDVPYGTYIRPYTLHGPALPSSPGIFL